MAADKKTAAKTRAAKKTALTIPDLVLLSLLAEQPMHGYQANLELERQAGTGLGGSFASTGLLLSGKAGASWLD